MIVRSPVQEEEPEAVDVNADLDLAAEEKAATRLLTTTEAAKAFSESWERWLRLRACATDPGSVAAVEVRGSTDPV